MNISKSNCNLITHFFPNWLVTFILQLNDVTTLRVARYSPALHFTSSSPPSVPPEHGTPTSVAFVATDPDQVVVSFDGGETLLYDLNTEQSVTALETQTKDGTSSAGVRRVEKFCSWNPRQAGLSWACFFSPSSAPQAASWSTAWSATRLSPSPSLRTRTAPSASWTTRRVCFQGGGTQPHRYKVKLSGCWRDPDWLFFRGGFGAGKVVHSMVAHLDAVTCLTTDPKGTYLVSGSE